MQPMGTMRSDQSAETIKFLSSRFGEIELPNSEILTMPEGLLGFGHLNRYAILKDPDEEPFIWLQSVDESDLSFVVVDPFMFFPGYEIQVKTNELSAIKLDDLYKATVLAIVTVPEDPMNLTANLRGPLVVNTNSKLAKQFVLIDDRYHTKHFLLKDIPSYLAVAPDTQRRTMSASSPKGSGK
jgi:flagellar assembly factor FliW